MDSLNMACVSALRINIGMNKFKLIKVLLIPSPYVVYIISCKSAVLNVK